MRPAGRPTTVGIVTGAGRGMGLECARRLIGAVDRLLLVDLDEKTVTAAADDLSTLPRTTVVEAHALDITDRAGLARLADRTSALGTLRAVVHAAGISPTMAGWRRVLTVDLVGTALLAEALRPLATERTAMVCFASMAALFGNTEPQPAAEAALAEPLDERFPNRLRAAVGRRRGRLPGVGRGVLPHRSRRPDRRGRARGAGRTALSRAAGRASRRGYGFANPDTITALVSAAACRSGLAFS